MTFVTIDAAPNAELLDVLGFLDLLSIDGFKLERKFVDVDTEYRNKYGKPASLIKNLLFDLPINFAD